MLNKKELTIIFIMTIILGFSLSLMRSLELFLWSSFSIFLVMMINIAAKKVASFYLDSEIELKLWSVKRYGFRPHDHFKEPFPFGAFLPILTVMMSYGYIVWLACFTFDVKAKIYRAARRYGLYSFSEMTEYHIGLIAAAGVIANLLFAGIGYIIGMPPQMNFVNLNIWFAFFSLIPFSDLDGSKIIFGNLIIWTFLTGLTGAALILSLLLI